MDDPHILQSDQPRSGSLAQHDSLRPLSLPDIPVDRLRMMLAFNRTQLQWFSDPEMMAWVLAQAG